jgi:hypothetical protein
MIGKLALPAAIQLPSDLRGTGYARDLAGARTVRPRCRSSRGYGSAGDPSEQSSFDRVLGDRQSMPVLSGLISA